MSNKVKFTIIAMILFLSLTGCGTEEAKPENAEWKVSPMFQSGAYTMIGQEGRLGFIYNDTETDRFYPKKQQKYMWHYWGTPEELQGPVQIIATSNEREAHVIVFEAEGVAGPNNGADAHHPSLMSLPSAGLWKLDAFIGEKYFGSVIVKVHERK